MAKRRTDQLLVDRGLAESRTKAQALIIAGLVSVSGRRLDKPGTALAEDVEMTVAGPFGMLTGTSVLVEVVPGGGAAGSTLTLRW